MADFTMLCVLEALLQESPVQIHPMESQTCAKLAWSLALALLHAPIA